MSNLKSNNEQWLKWAETNAVKHLTDINNANDAITSKAFKMTLLFGIASMLIFFCVNATAGIIGFVVCLFLCILVFLINDTESTGFSSSNVNLVYNGEYININPETFILHKNNKNEDIWAFVFNELQKRENKSMAINTKLTKSYRLLLQAIVLGLLAYLYCLASSCFY
jgi:ABC-type protease/lipase transport system fused ATPase/permease subunit